MLKDIDKKTDRHSMRSSKHLQAVAKQAITSVFTRCLKCIEMKFGTEFVGYNSIRKEILDVGNDTIRKLNELVEINYNIEYIPEKIVTSSLKGKEVGDE
jgi:hypothetical protein